MQALLDREAKRRTTLLREVKLEATKISSARQQERPAPLKTQKRGAKKDGATKKKKGEAVDGDDCDPRLLAALERIAEAERVALQGEARAKRGKRVPQPRKYLHGDHA
jgi:hypothetical protein